MCSSDLSNLVEINYEKKKITVYRNTNNIRKKIEKKFQNTPITIEKLKPYLWGSVVINTDKIPVKLLIDIGNSDAVWLFQNISDKIKVPQKNFEDYLGKGFSGDVEGKRAQIKKFTISPFEFQNLVIAFPDTMAIRNVKIDRKSVV